MNMITWLTYFVGILLHIALQIQNSIQSNANGLQGWQGVKDWLKINLVSVLGRMFLAAMIFPAVLGGKIADISSVLSDMNLPGWSVAGIVGYCFDSLLNQVFGLIPGLRKDVPLVAPPK